MKVRDPQSYILHDSRFLWVMVIIINWHWWQWTYMTGLGRHTQVWLPPAGGSLSSTHSENPVWCFHIKLSTHICTHHGIRFIYLLCVHMFSGFSTCGLWLLEVNCKTWSGLKLTAVFSLMQVEATQEYKCPVLKEQALKDTCMLYYVPLQLTDDVVLTLILYILYA